MNTDNLILLNDLCVHYQIELSFIHRLSDIGLIEVTQVEDHFYLAPERVAQLERIIRIHTELDVNEEGIDVVFNLLEQIEELKAQVIVLENRLKVHEDH